MAMATVVGSTISISRGVTSRKKEQKKRSQSTVWGREIKDMGSHDERRPSHYLYKFPSSCFVV
jgi:hypothetical protein